MKDNKKLILIYTTSKSRYNNIFNTINSDNRSEHFPAVRERFLRLGYHIEYANKQPVDSVFAVIFLDHYNNRAQNSIKMLFKWILNYFWVKEILKQDKGILIIWEGESVNSHSFDHRLNSVFNQILTWNDSLVDNVKYFKYLLPVSEKWNNTTKVPFNEKKLLVNISYNKTSNNIDDLYFSRLEVITFFDKYYPDLFDLYGYGWNVNIFNTYKGTVERKADVLPNYKFCICYENAKGKKGYITEKIFDCMRSNCVPIYHGASNVEEYIPLEAFIDARNFKSTYELFKYIQRITEYEYSDYLDRINDFLESEAFEKFKTTAFVDTLENIVIKKQVS